MSQNLNSQPVIEAINKSQRILVLFGQQASLDYVAAALSLYLTIKEMGKDILIASPAELRAELSRLVGLDQISDSISNRDLVIGFTNYDFGDIERVSHNEGANNRFELIIQPKAGKRSPDPKQVDFSFRGADADLILAVGINRLEDLGKLYETERQLFTKATVVAFSRRNEITFATYSLVDQQASSVSEIMAQFLKQLQKPATNDIATNLLAGIDFATNRFQNPVVPATTFITAGELVAQGARRLPPRMAPAGLAGSAEAGFVPFIPEGQVKPGVGQSQTAGQVRQPSQAAGQTPPPAEWLQPKIYKGGTRV